MLGGNRELKQRSTVRRKSLLEVESQNVQVKLGVETLACSHATLWMG